MSKKKYWWLTNYDPNWGVRFKLSKCHCSWCDVMLYILLRNILSNRAWQLRNFCILNLFSFASSHLYMGKLWHFCNLLPDCWPLRKIHRWNRDWIHIKDLSGQTYAFQNDATNQINNPVGINLKLRSIDHFGKSIRDCRLSEIIDDKSMQRQIWVIWTYSLSWMLIDCLNEKSTSRSN